MHRYILNSLTAISIAIIALLPSSAEYLYLTINIGNSLANYQLQLVLIILFTRWLCAPRHLIPISLVIFIIIISGLKNINKYPDSSSFFVAASCYIAPFFAIYWTRNSATAHESRIRFTQFIFYVIAIQGIGVFFFGQLLSELTGGIMSFGESVRDSFDNYRFGSTVASANTSGIILASCFILLWLDSKTQKNRIIILASLTIALIGFQSRSGFLIISVYFLLEKNIPLYRRLFFVALIFAGLVFVTALRVDDEINSSNLARLYYFLEAYDFTKNADWVTFTLGAGPGMGISRSLSSYYGAPTNSEAQLLSGAESFLAVSIVEIGCLGTATLLFSLWLILRKDTRAIAIYLTYITIDPSNLRFFESFLMGCILSILASQSHNAKNRNHINTTRIVLGNSSHFAAGRKKIYKGLQNSDT